ncbi:MAG: hypothetical protein AAGE84_16375 [Cyanobacteria bacterium P01_G01_bin.39]
MKHGDFQGLNQIYRKSLKGKDLLYKLLNDGEPSIRGGAVSVIAAMPTIAESSIPKLETLLKQEEINWIRGGIAFALGEFGASTTLEKILTSDECLAVRCIAACQLARIAPQESLIEPLLLFTRQPIDEYQYFFGAGLRSTDDAAFALSGLIKTLLSEVFEEREQPLTKLTNSQKLVLSHLLVIGEIWSMPNLLKIFSTYGLLDGCSNLNKKVLCAKLVGIELTPDDALKEVRRGMGLAKMNFLPHARESLLKAIEMDATVFERVPTPEEGWLLYAKAFAECNPQQAVTAFRRAYLINPAIERQVAPNWCLANLLQEYDF